MIRRKSRKIKIGDIFIGADADIAVQSMLNARSEDFAGNIRQAKELEKVGCDILRVAIPNMKVTKLICKLKENVKIPIVADIHFNFKLAIESVAAGADKIRINPGNIGEICNIKAVVDACKVKDIPIRVGVNSGSLEKNVMKKYSFPCAEAMCESALYNVALIEKFDYDKIVVSIKSSDVIDTVRAYRLVSQKIDYPLHLGVTEAGTEKSGTVKSAIGVGSLLLDGIGDTIRVSLTDDPIKEVCVAKEILKSLGIHKKGISFISCPTCGRTKIDVIGMANQLEKMLVDCDKKLKIAVMGCVVNGPGEAMDADLGISGGDGVGVIFKKGKIIRRVKEEFLVKELIEEIKKC